MHAVLRVLRRAAVAGVFVAMAAQAAEPKDVVLVDEEVIVSRKGTQARSFTLESPAEIAFVVSGVENTDKGFDVDVLEAEEFERLTAGDHWTFIPEFDREKVTAVNLSSELKPGKYVAVVRNRYNVLKSMKVRIKLTATKKKAGAKG